MINDGAGLCLPGCEYISAGDGGVVGHGDVAGSDAELMEGEAEAQQVGTHSQAKLQQETAQEVVLGLEEEERMRNLQTQTHFFNYWVTGLSVGSPNDKSFSMF